MKYGLDNKIFLIDRIIFPQEFRMYVIGKKIP